MNFKKFSLVFLGILFSIPILSIFSSAQLGSNYPQFPFQTWYSPEALATFLGVPADWLTVPRVIYYVIVPFIVAVTVVYGILTELRIFRGPSKDRVNIILAVAMAFLLLPSGILTTIVDYFYAAGTFIGLVGFGILFIIGTILWVYGTGHRLWGENAPRAVLLRREYRKSINEIDEQIREVRDQMASVAGDTAKIKKLQDKLAALETKREQYKDKLITLDTATI